MSLEIEFGHFYFSWPPLTSSTSEVSLKTSNFIVNFDVEKRRDFVVSLGESIIFEYLRHYATFKNSLHIKVTFHILQYCYCKNWNVSTDEGLAKQSSETDQCLYSERDFCNATFFPICYK